MSVVVTQEQPPQYVQPVYVQEQPPQYQPQVVYTQQPMPQGILSAHRVRLLISSSAIPTTTSSCSTYPRNPNSCHHPMEQGILCLHCFE